MNASEGQDLKSKLAEAARHRTVLDVDDQRVAKVYAAAFLNAAAKHAQPDSVLEELESLVEDLFRADPQLEMFFSSNAIGRRPKEALIRKVLGGRASDVFVNFLLVLNDHDRLDMLRPILSESRRLQEQRTGKIRVEVRSAVPLPDDQRERLMQQLRETFHREPLLEARVDPELLGGLVVQAGNWLYDASVRTQLEELRTQIIERSSHEIQSGRDRFSS